MYQNDAKNVPKERRFCHRCTNLTNFVPKYTNKRKIGKMAAILPGYFFIFCLFLFSFFPLTFLYHHEQIKYLSPSFPLCFEFRVSCFEFILILVVFEAIRDRPQAGNLLFLPFAQLVPLSFFHIYGYIIIIIFLELIY